MRQFAGLLLAVVVLVFSLAAKPAAPPSFSDNFNGGHLARWWFDPPNATPSWRIDDHVLLSPVGDHKALVDQMVFSSQTIQTSVYLTPDLFGAFGGVTLWYQDATNYVSVVVYPAEGSITLYEVIDGIATVGHYGGRTWIGQWYRLRVNADSVTGAMAIYLDGVYAGTHVVQTDIRSGFSGLCTGNGDVDIDYTAAFDNFKVARPAGGKKK